jgi:dUTP pyrophosphatase
VIIRFKKLQENAVMPSYSREGDAAVDLVAVSMRWDDNEKTLTYGTGLALEIPKGYVGKLYARSSISRYDLALCNCVGIVDSNYRGEIMFKFKELVLGSPKSYNVGDRIGQLIIEPVLEMNFVEVSELSDTNRGEQGFGSSGV